MDLKYKLGRRVRIKHPLRNGYAIVQRVVALRDIPRHGVKAGDIGGYVDSKKTLSQEGDCWIGDEAMALDKSIVKGDAVVRGNAVISDTLVRDNAAVYGNARLSEAPGIRESGVGGSAKVYGDALLVSTRVRGYSEVHEAAVVNRAIVSGYSIVHGFAKVMGPDIKIEDSKIYGYAEIHSNASVTDSIVHCQAVVHSSAKVRNAILLRGTVVREKNLFNGSSGGSCCIDGKDIQTSCAYLYEEKAEASLAGVPVDAPTVASVPTERERLDAIEQKYAEYENDIVKIIKYPVMTDPTDPHTAKFTSALRRTQRLFEQGNMPAYRDTLDQLEDAFHVAEWNARKISLSRLVPDERNKVADARQMLAIAMDGASSDTEKKNAFKGAMRNLEGIVAVPDAALSSLRQKIGLLEIEA